MTDRPYTSLKDLLSRVRPGDDFDVIANRIERLIASYNRPGVHKQFRQDVVQMIGSVLDLAENMSQQQYRLDEVFNDIAEIQQFMSLLLRHGLVSRPRVTGYALFNTVTVSILPGFYTTREEASKQLDFLNTLNIAMPLTIIPVECVTSTIIQPEEQNSTQQVIEPPVRTSPLPPFAPDPTLPNFLNKPPSPPEPSPPPLPDEKGTSAK